MQSLINNSQTLRENPDSVIEPADQTVYHADTVIAGTQQILFSNAKLKASLIDNAP